MFGRQVTIKLKANLATEFTRINVKEILPLLRKHKGLRDETTFLAPDRSEAIANSFWDSKEDAEAYSRTGYAEVMKTIASLVEGTPTIKTFELASSTFHQRAAANAA